MGSRTTPTYSSKSSAGAQASAGCGLQLGLCTAEPSKAPSDLTFDECFQALADHRGSIQPARQFGGACQQFIIDIDRRPHWLGS
jgi:hypothetical protein